MSWFKRSSGEGNEDELATPVSTTSAIDELSPSEVEWVAQRLALLEDLGLDRDDVTALGAFFDGELSTWLATPELHRQDPNERINCIGIGLGEYIRTRADMSWVLATDSYGSEIAIHREPGNIVLFPTNMVAKRWTAAEVGELPALAAAAIASVEDVVRRTL